MTWVWGVIGIVAAYFVVYNYAESSRPSKRATPTSMSEPQRLQRSQEWVVTRNPLKLSSGDTAHQLIFRDPDGIADVQCVLLRSPTQETVVICPDLFWVE